MLVLIVLASIAAAAGAPGTQAKPAACKYQENCDCDAPGITVRWKAAYCMLLNATDDYEQEGVMQCMNLADPPSLQNRTACERNTHWKQQFCRARHEDDAVRVRACVDDPTIIPRIVEVGVGGAPVRGDRR